jgi:hypothetical protein
MRIALTHEDLQRVCYHLQRAEKESKLTDKDAGTLLKIKAMVLAHEESQKRSCPFHDDGCDP